jgi:hypothetical protein
MVIRYPKSEKRSKFIHFYANCLGEEEFHLWQQVWTEKPRH